MPSQKTPVIAIIGQGIAGIATAYMLAQQKYHIYLVGTKHPVKGGIQLAKNGLNALAQIGLDDAAIMQDSTQIESIIIRQARHYRQLAELRFTANQPYIAIQRASLINHIRACLDKYDRIEQIESDVTGITNSKSKQPLITLKNNQQISVDEIIGADGLHGYCRPFVNGGDHMPDISSYCAQRATIDSDLLPRHFSRPATQLVLGNGYHFVFYPLVKQKKINIVICAKQNMFGTGWPMRFFSNNRFFSSLDHPNIQWAQAPLYQSKHLDIWRRQHVTLIGDAAHIMPPHLAQGTGQTFEDIACLQKTLREHRLSHALDIMANIRSVQVKTVTQKADFVGHIMRLSGPAAQMRNICLETAATPFLQKWLKDIWR